MQILLLVLIIILFGVLPIVIKNWLRTRLRSHR